MSPFDRAPMTFCWRTIVTMALSRVVSEISNVEKYRDLEIRVTGHSRSLKIESFSRSCTGFLLVFISNFVPKTHRFGDIRLVSIPWPWNLVKGHSTSLKMSPCDRTHITFYWCSIVTMALSRVVSEIFNVQKRHDLEIGVKGHSRILKVLPFDKSCMVSY